MSNDMPEIKRYPDLINRLRGIYTVPVNDGAGLLDGKDTFTRNFETSPIHHEAAAAIAERDKLIEVMREALQKTRDIISSGAVEGFNLSVLGEDWALSLYRNNGSITKALALHKAFKEGGK